MLIVKLEKKVNIEKALRKLKTKVIKTKQLRRLRDGKAFTKPSAKKRTRERNRMSETRKTAVERKILRISNFQRTPHVHLHHSHDMCVMIEYNVPFPGLFDRFVLSILNFPHNLFRASRT